MFTKVIAIVSVFATFAAATPLPGAPGASCNAGPVQCCNQVQPAGTPEISQILGMFNIPVENANVPVGVNCSPISAIGAGSGGTCESQPVCCSDNSHGSLLALGCLPISLNA